MMKQTGDWTIINKSPFTSIHENFVNKDPQGNITVTIAVKNENTNSNHGKTINVTSIKLRNHK